jgi:hypothetical protein
MPGTGKCSKLPSRISIAGLKGLNKLVNPGCFARAAWS